MNQTARRLRVSRHPAQIRYAPAVSPRNLSLLRTLHFSRQRAVVAEQRRLVISATVAAVPRVADGQPITLCFCRLTAYFALTLLLLRWLGWFRSGSALASRRFGLGLRFGGLL